MIKSPTPLLSARRAVPICRNELAIARSVLVFSGMSRLRVNSERLGSSCCRRLAQRSAEKGFLRSDSSSRVEINAVLSSLPPARSHPSLDEILPFPAANRDIRTSSRISCPLQKSPLPTRREVLSSAPALASRFQ